MRRIYACPARVKRKASGRSREAIDRGSLPGDFEVIHRGVAGEGAAHQIFGLSRVALKRLVVFVLVHDPKGEFGKQSRPP
jgi:hypothetical protein